MQKNLNKYNIRSSIVIAIMITAVLSATYAFVNLSANSTTSNSVAGCFEVQYTGTPISNALVSTTNYLEGSHSKVTLSKGTNCKIYTTATIYIHTNTTTTAPIAQTQALKYKVMSGTTEVSTGLINQTGDKSLATVTLTETATTYDVYIWVDSEISDGAYNEKTYSGYIYATSDQTSTIKQ